MHYSNGNCFCLFVCLENLAVQPNSEKLGSPNSPTNKKIFLNSLEHDLFNKHVKCSDQQMGGALQVLSGMDFKFMKVCTIILVIDPKIWEEYTFHKQKICTQSGGHRGLHPEPMPNSNIHENFIKIKFLISNLNLI